MPAHNTIAVSYTHLDVYKRQAMNVSLYRPIADNDTRKITALLNYYKTLYKIIALGVTVIGIVLVPFLKYLVNMETKIPYLTLYYIVFVLKNTASYLFIYKSSLLRACLLYTSCIHCFETIWENE